MSISQNKLARRCGFSPGHLSVLMNVKRDRRPHARRRLTEALTVEDFDPLGITEPPEVEGRGPENTEVPERRKSFTNATTATPIVTPVH